MTARRSQTASPRKLLAATEAVALAESVRARFAARHFLAPTHGGNRAAADMEASALMAEAKELAEAVLLAEASPGRFVDSTPEDEHYPEPTFVADEASPQSCPEAKPGSDWGYLPE